MPLIFSQASSCQRQVKCFWLEDSSIGACFPFLSRTKPITVTINPAYGIGACIAKALQSIEARGVESVFFPKVEAYMERELLAALWTYASMNDLTIAYPCASRLDEKSRSNIQHFLKEGMTFEEEEAYSNALEAWEERKRLRDEEKKQQQEKEEEKLRRRESNETFRCVLFDISDPIHPYDLKKSIDSLEKEKPLKPREPRPKEAWQDKIDIFTDVNVLKTKGVASTIQRYLRLRNISPSLCYRRANLDRRLFSKIMSQDGYQPSKPTLIAICIALKLDYDQTLDLLLSGGFTLSKGIMFDSIITYCILSKIFSLFEVNTILCNYDLPILGSR